MNHDFPAGYQLQLGTKDHRGVLLDYLKLTYQELCPWQDNFEHLTATVNQYFSDRTPLWLIEPIAESNHQSFVGCLWMGKAIDQRDGTSYSHILLIFVAPQHRRRGLGKALLQVAKNYARSQGNRVIGLQVFTNNQAAINLYQNAGFLVQSVLMTKQLEEES